MKIYDHIRVLGTGTSVPEQGIYPSSYLISINSKLILIDAGQGISGRIVNLGYKLKDIHTIILTHIHSDHIMGIPEIIMAIINDDRIERHTINIFISSDYISFIKNDLLFPWKEWIHKANKMRLKYIPLNEKENYKHKLFEIIPFSVHHHPSSFGIIIKTGGKQYIFTGDTDIFDIENINESNTEMIFIESTSDNFHKINGHLTVAEAVNLIQRTRIPTVYLTHFLPQYRKKIEKFTETLPKTEGQFIKTAFEGQIIPL